MEVRFKIDCFNGDNHSLKPEIIPLKVSQNDVIVKVKQNICNYNCNISKDLCNKAKYFVLKYGGINLDDNKNLMSYNIHVGDTVIFSKIQNFDPKNIVVVKILGNFYLPSVIQVEINKTIREMKEIISTYSNVGEFSIFKDGYELEDNLVLNNINIIDDCQIYAVQRKVGVLKINCLMKNQECLDIDYAITNKVCDIKQRVSSKYHYNMEDFVLFLDKEWLDDDRYLFEYKMNVNQEITYCHITRCKVILDKEPMTKGTFCDIYKGKDDRNNDVIVKKYTCIQDEKLQRYKQLLSELTTFQIIQSNPKFVQLLAFYKEDNSFYVVMEYMKKGSLDHHIKQHMDIPRNTLASWSKQILEALQFLNQNSVIYRDLKPSNIYLDSYGVVKLGGFSLSKYLLGASKEDLVRGSVQTIPKNYRYMAPEVLNNEEYGIKIDVWSLGAILLAIVTGHPPYHDLDEITASLKIARERAIEYQVPEDTPESLANFIAQCLQGNPENRKTAEELLEHKFLDIVEEYSALVVENMELG